MPDMSDSAGSNSLPAALIVPDAERRRALSVSFAESRLTIDKEFDAWPSRDDLGEIAPLNCRVAFVDVDCDTGEAIQVIENICRYDVSMTVMGFSNRKTRSLEVVLNRFNSRNGAIDERSATKALARPVNWRIPNCYEAARAAEDNGVPLAMEDSPITRALSQMAKSACGKSLRPAAKVSKGPGFFSPRWQSVQAET
ncbi:MAG: hypothetical protein ABSG41_18100 [Bryobacteraceae bacterium]